MQRIKAYDSICIIILLIRERQNLSKSSRRLEKKAKELAQQIDEERAKADQFKDAVIFCRLFLLCNFDI